MKQTKLWLITIAMLLCSLTASAHDFEVSGIYYNITSSTDLTVAVTYRGRSYYEYSNEYSGAVTIPSTVTYNSKTYSVTSIGSYAFYDCNSLTSITIPESVTSIGHSAFSGCSSLTAITIPESVTSIGDYAFEYCSSLYKVINYSNLSLSAGSSDYGYVAYYAKQVIKGSELRTIGDFQFLKSNGDLVNYTGKDTDITLPNDYNGANYGIGACAFYSCSSLTSIVIPESVTSIGNYAFDNCTALKEIIFEDGSETLSLGYNYYYSNSTGGEGLFYDCPLESVYLGRNLSYSSDKSYGYSPFYNKTNLADIVIGDKVTSIGSCAFSGCSGLTSITIPESVTSIGGSAFSGCSGLIQVTLNCSYIGSWFSYNSSIEKVVLGENVTSIVDYAFRSCSGLTSINIPESVTSIGEDAFYNCSGLTAVHINSLEAWCNISFSDSYSNPLYYAKNLYLNEELVTALTIPEGVSSIGNYAFYNCSGLTSITIPEDVTSIGSCAFDGCSSLTSITIPEDVTSIGNYAFDNCTALKKVIFEDGSETLTLGYNCYSSSSTGGEGLFYDCPLESVYLGRNLSYSSDKSYGYSPFYNKDALTKVTIGNEVTEIGQYAFYGCDNIHSLTMGSGVLSIGSSAFSAPDKVIWLTNTPPTGYAVANGSINYVSNNQYTSLSNVKVYPYLSSMFEVDGVKYVPVSPSERTCHAIDCAYDESVATINVSETASFKGVAMKVTEVMPYTFYGNDYIKEASVSHKGSIGNYAFYGCDSIETAIIDNSPKETVSTTPQPTTFADWTSTNHGDSSTSSETYSFTATKGVTLSFDWSVSSESGYDKLIVTLDGTTILEKSGSLNGTYSNEVSQGEHTLVVKYTKDSSNSSGSDQAKVSNILVSAGSSTNVLDGAVCNGVFYGCVSLKSVTLGDKVTSLGNNAFRGCISLQGVVIPESMTFVGTDCFNGCSLLSTISIPQAVTTIGDYAFSGCTQLADIIIEDRTTALNLGSNGSSALFVDCPLDSVYIGGKITYNTTSSKGYSPFYRNTSLRSVVITDREVQIYDNEFYGCTNLQNVTIGNGVKSIGNYAFSGCSSLAGFSFGSNMETIGAEAFSDCTNLTSITSHAAMPPTCGTQALDDINKWDCVLGVPLGNADAYYAADQWKEFFFINDVVEVDHYLLTYMVDGEVYHTEVLKHKDEVTMLAEPTKVGYEFSGWDKTLTTMPAEDVIISGTFVRLPIENLVILDTESSFVVDEEMECKAITYTRTFTDTEWQALYVPFDIVVTEALLADFDIAYLNDIRQYDHDDDGTKDETVVEAFKMKGGVLEANYPYLIRAKEVGEKCIALTDATLYATEENSYDCSSLYELYTFTGTYNTMSSETLTPGEGYYTLIDGEWRLAEEETLLGAFRFYLKVDSRNGEVAAAQAIRMRVVGDDNDDENTEGDTTGVAPSTLNAQPSSLYDLMGRRVEKATKGIYIVNGKKTVVK